MMIDLKLEQLISFSDAARFLPNRRGGRKVHVSCIYRWAKDGCRGVKLEAVQVGGTKCTSREALARFFDRLSDLPEKEISIPSAAKRADAAERELDRLGI